MNYPNIQGVYVVSAVMLLFVLGCGGGSVSFHPYPKNLRPAYYPVRQIETVNTREALDKILLDLNGTAGDNLDWEQFWNLLNQSPVLDKVVDEFADLLLTLHGRDCSSEAFSAFKRLILDHQYIKGMPYLRPPKRLCDRTLSPEEAVTVVTLEWSSSSLGKRAELASELIDFLVREREKSPSVGWSHALNGESQQRLLPLFETLVANGKFDLALKFWNQHRSLSGDALFATYVQEELFTRHLELWSVHAESEGLSASAQRLSGLLSFLKEKKQLPTSDWILDEEWLNLLLGVSREGKLRSFEKIRDWPAAYAQFQILRNLIDQMSEKIGLIEKLLLIDKVSDGLYQWAKGERLGLAPVWISEEIQQSPNSLRNLELAWVALRLDSSWKDKVAFKLRTIQSAPQTPEEKILIARLRLYAAPEGATPDALGALASDFCKIMESQGIPTKHYAADEFNAQHAATPGCKVIYPDKMNSALRDPYRNNPQRELNVKYLFGSHNTLFIFKNFRTLNISEQTTIFPAVWLNSNLEGAVWNWNPPSSSAWPILTIKADSLIWNHLEKSKQTNSEAGGGAR